MFTLYFPPDPIYDATIKWLAADKSRCVTNGGCAFCAKFDNQHLFLVKISHPANDNDLLNKLWFSLHKSHSLFRNTLCLFVSTVVVFTKVNLCYTAQNALQQEWGNFPFANWNGICWGLLLQLVQLIEIHFLPHLESFMWEQKFEKKFFKKSHIQTPNGVLLIFKLPFPNGSYRNGVCRALWAKPWKSKISNWI